MHRSEHACPDEAFSAANADPNSTGGYNYVQAEIFNQNNRQWANRVRLEYQRQHQGVCPLQLPARGAAVPGGPVVAQYRPGSISHADPGPEPFGLRIRHDYSRFQSQHDQRDGRSRTRSSGSRTCLQDPSKVDRIQSRLWICRTVPERRRADPLIRQLWRPSEAALDIQSGWI